MSVAQRMPAEVMGILKNNHWRQRLKLNERNVPRPLLNNCLIALREAPEWRDVLGFNEFSICVVALQPTPFGLSGTWTDIADLRTTEWLQNAEIHVSSEVAAQAVQVVAHERPFHAAREWLGRLEWDGKPRLSKWLPHYVGTADSNYSQAVGERWIISAIARVFQPGVKADCSLLLEGAQGIGKTTVFKILGGEFYTDEIAELGTKDASLQLQGVLIVELSELDALGKSEVSRIKSFMSRTTDRFRPPYGKRVIECPRQCVFGGTVNHSEYLRDETGARRFWPVACGRIDLDALVRDRDQLWAEAKVKYDAGRTWWLDNHELVSAAAMEQAERFEGDTWEGPISKWTSARYDVSVSEVLNECLEKLKSQWTQSDKNRVARCLRSAGWERYNSRTGSAENGREWRYRRAD